MLAKRHMYVTLLTLITRWLPNCKHALKPNKFHKEAANKWALVIKPLPFDILSLNIYMSWAVSKLLELKCHWKVLNHTRRGLTKRVYTIYPPKTEKLLVNYNRLLNAWGLVTGTAVLPDEKCLSSKTEVYLLLSIFSEKPLGFLLRPYAATGRKPNVSLADLIRCCPFTQGHSGVFRFLVVLFYGL